MVECHAMRGYHDYLLQMTARSMAHFSELYMERILKLPGVTNIESSFRLVAVKANVGLPIG